VIAKAQQFLPEWKRSPDEVLDAVAEDALFDETSSTRACGLLAQLNFIPKIAKELQNDPESVLRQFEEIRKYRESNKGNYYGQIRILTKLRLLPVFVLG
jgi:hypothetical protein